MMHIEGSAMVNVLFQATPGIGSSLVGKETII